jgi:trehalose 6-phosphate synthase
LVLSEFAGAAAQLHEHAFLVNPYDVEGAARALRQALMLDLGARQARMAALRRIVAESDVFWWTRLFLDTARGTLDELPPVSEFVPNLEREAAG